jgi:hypothetical protein
VLERGEGLLCHAARRVVWHREERESVCVRCGNAVASVGCGSDGERGADVVVGPRREVLGKGMCHAARHGVWRTVACSVLDGATCGVETSGCHLCCHAGWTIRAAFVAGRPVEMVCSPHA